MCEKALLRDDFERSRLSGGGNKLIIVKKNRQEKVRKKLGCYVCECAPSKINVGEGWWKIFRDRIVFRGNGRGNQSSPG